MRLKTRTWFVISLLCFIGAWYFWRLGEEKAARAPRNQPETSGPASTAQRTNLSGVGAPKPLLIERSPSPLNGERAGVRGETVPSASTVPDTNSPYPYRLSNTPKGIGELTRSDSAILLRNAL